MINPAVMMTCQACAATCKECIVQCAACPNKDAMHQACIDACNKCIADCEKCMADCLSGNMDMAVMMKCSTDCMACVEMLEMCAEKCPLCKQVCEKCSESCGVCSEMCDMAMGKNMEQPMPMKTVKATGDWELEVLGVPFGDRSNLDSDGQYFDADTNTHQDKYPTVPAVYFHGRDPQGKPINPEYIGKATPLRTDERGSWYQVILDKTKALAQRVWDAAKNGTARASSGSAPHLVRTNGARISEWPVVELSVFDTGEGRQPSNRYAVVMPMVKAIYDEAGIELPSEIHPEAQANAADDKPTKSKKEVKDMETNEVQILIDAALKADRDAQAQAQEAAKSRKAEIDAEVAKQVEAVKAEAAKGRRLPDYDGVAPYATQFNDSAFDNLNACDLALGIDVLKANGKRVPAGAIKSLALKVISETGKTEEREQDLRYIKAAMPAEMKDEKYLKAAGDLNASVTNTGFGPEWVGTAYSAELWRSIRHDGGIVGKIPSVVIPDGFASQYFPLEGADPTWYHVAENLTNGTTLGSPVATITSSQVATGQKNLAVNKAGARVTYSGELTEDSIVTFAPQLREQLVVSGAEMMEHVVIDGDTTVTASANINAFDSDPDDAVIYGLLDGFRHLALVTTTTNGRAGGALSIEDYIETLRLMGTAGLGGSDFTKVSFIVDANTHWANMKLPEVATRDVHSAATIENGFLKRAYGVEILPSWQMHKNSAGRKTNSAGLIVTSEATNLYGAILAVRWDQWKMGYKRRMTIESTRFANSDSYEIVALTRFGLAYRDGEAAAITYGLTV